uniref:Vacuolar protein sorting-associated protein 29 n=2 Tax=Chloropicon primus TaxID=1764295 RepID=A0A7S2T3Y5_9CHLO|mmetsp:Transcript_4800/g.14320  ORF Transcript_4800/g.14320 Transcript_4800/m.14320 type:complete len:219 (+) Transcript_4800:192-848(+)
MIYLSSSSSFHFVFAVVVGVCRSERGEKKRGGGDMVLVLCLGDLHVPYRTSDLPQQFKDILLPGKVGQILCTGDICTKEMYDYLKTICTNIHVVKGQFDEDHAYPETKVVKIGDLKFGLVHGHTVIPWGDISSLGMVQRQMDVDVLISGHTHEFRTYAYEDKLLVNPGSATGAYSSKEASTTPSFCLFDVDSTKATIYTYKLKDGEVKKEKMFFEKRA